MAVSFSSFGPPGHHPELSGLCLRVTTACAPQESSMPSLHFSSSYLLVLQSTRLQSPASLPLYLPAFLVAFTHPIPLFAPSFFPSFYSYIHPNIHPSPLKVCIVCGLCQSLVIQEEIRKQESTAFMVLGDKREIKIISKELHID